MYDAKDVAMIVIFCAKEMRVEINNLKLQKVLYYIQAEYLKNFNKPCFKNDIVVWGLGAVIPEVYYNFAISGNIDLRNYKICLNKNMNVKDFICIKYFANKYLDMNRYELIEMNKKEPHIVSANVGDKVDIGVMAKYFRSTLIE